MMNGKERISRQLKRQPVDVIGAAESFWSFTQDKWVRDGKIPEGTNLTDHFNFDYEGAWIGNLAIDPEFANVTVAEDEDTITYLNGNGATLRSHKKHASTPEHLGYSIRNRADWEEKAKPFLKPTPNRVNFDGYRAAREKADREGRFLFVSNVNAFEAIHPITGHEYMLEGMALDPDWVLEMAHVFSDLIINLWEELFAKVGKPDGVWYYEDMGFKGRPFMSPDMYRELIMPAHKKSFDWAHGHGLPVVVHSCGMVDSFVPSLVEAGMDCLQAMEVKAGMDLLKLYKDFGEKISFIGGLDVRPVATNNIPAIKAELDAKIPLVKKRNGFILHSDHSIPESTEYDTYRYFLDYGRKLGTY